MDTTRLYRCILYVLYIFYYAKKAVFVRGVNTYNVNVRICILFVFYMHKTLIRV